MFNVIKFNMTPKSFCWKFVNFGANLLHYLSYYLPEYQNRIEKSRQLFKVTLYFSIFIALCDDVTIIATISYWYDFFASIMGGYLTKPGYNRVKK